MRDSSSPRPWTPTQTRAAIAQPANGAPYRSTFSLPSIDQVAENM